MVWEGRFKNLQQNIHLIHNGFQSASQGAEPFWKPKDLQTKKRHVSGSFGIIKEVSKEELQLKGSGSKPIRVPHVTSSAAIGRKGPPK